MYTFHIVWKVPRVSWQFPDFMETIQNVWKLPDCPGSFFLFQKVSALCGMFRPSSKLRELKDNQKSLVNMDCFKNYFNFSLSSFNFPSSQVPRFQSSQVPNFPNSQVLKFPSSHVPKFPSSQIFKFQDPTPDSEVQCSISWWHLSNHDETRRCNIYKIIVSNFCNRISCIEVLKLRRGGGLFLKISKITNRSTWRMDKTTLS